MKPTEDDLRGLLRELRRALRNLAADADHQRSFIERLGTAPLIDELALEFGDRYIVAPMLCEFGKLSPPQVAALDAVEAPLKKMSGRANAELRTLDALHRVEWAMVRDLDAAALNTFDDEAPGELA